MRPFLRGVLYEVPVKRFAAFALLLCFPSPAGAEGPSQAAVAGHWAFQPVKKPVPPALAGASRVQQPLDAFVIAAQQAKGLQLAPPADRTTLIKRAYFNLTGMPPSVESVEAFLADPDPAAFTKVVDRLLADPRFGERWARYWLDVARYADSKGYVFQEERRYAYAFTYRDWVIKSLNSDLPVDKFLSWQLAADQLAPKDDPNQLAALGFLTLGRRFLNNEPDIIDDRIDVTARGMMGLTVACARCHDHKFDPIPTADYYSLYGVFASSEEPKEKPLLGEPERTPEYLAFEAELKKKEQAVADYQTSRHRALFEEGSLQQYLTVCAEAWSQPDDAVSRLAKDRKIYPSVALKWRTWLKKLGEKHPVAAPWLALVKLPADQFAAGRESALVQLSASVAVNPLIAEALRQAPPANPADLAKLYAKLLAAHKTDTPEPDANAEAMRLVIMSPEGVKGMDPAALTGDYSVPERDEARRLRNEVESYKATAENGPARGMVLLDRAQPVEPAIFLRGNQHSRGAKVPRQNLGILGGAGRQPFKQGSGRAELARDLVSPSNPLTTRVFANRIWTWSTGSSLVDTPSDFGVRTQPPVIPGLLDHLASSLVDDGWSLKKLLRQILLSSTWQQSSQTTAAATAIDPENRLLWHANRRRLDFEAFRDSLLRVSGALSPKKNGRPVDIESADATCRTIYGFIDRQNLPNLFRSFDFASPDQHAPKRFQTTVPQQALFSLNNPFVIKQASRLLQRPGVSAAKDPAEKVRQLYRAALSRNPDAVELKAALAFTSATFTGQTAGDWEYGFGGWDEAAKKINWTPFPSFTENRWSASAKVPDPTHGWVMLSGGGGHPGHDNTHAAILRWTAPEPAALKLKGRIARAAEAGNGVRLRLATDRQGLLKEWDAPAKGKVDTAADFTLAEGETVSFIIDAKDDENSDGFLYDPVLTNAKTGSPVAHASQDFAGPALDPWTAFAQVLLCGNEFMFVD